MGEFGRQHKTMSINMKEELKLAIKRSFIDLIKQDGELFGCQIDEKAEKNGRKLHEVCINNKLSIYLSNHIFPLLQEREQQYFADIEFNRNGKREKALLLDGSSQVVRPDIIIHNRKDGTEKGNFLIVECKKVGCSKKDYVDDILKIKGLMESKDYEYEYGLMVVYNKTFVEAQFFWHTEVGIFNERFVVKEKGCREKVHALPSDRP